MRLRYMILAAAAMLPCTPALASFTYTPAPAPVVEAPIIQETAQDVWAGKEPIKPAPLVNPDAAVKSAVKEAQAQVKATDESLVGKTFISPTAYAQPGPGNASSANAAGIPNVKPVANVVQTAPAVGVTPIYEDTFVLGPGSLREQLEKYAKRSGYQVAWNHPDDFTVNNTTTFASGGFVDNVRQLFETLQDIGRWDFSATLFDGNRTLVVELARR